jgi:multidrug efflux pump subunit AcrB
MTGRIVTPFERALTTTVNDIEHIEGVSYAGFGVVKIFFQPTADIRTANSQVVAVSQTLLRLMPAGVTPPLVLNYNASTVPIIQLALSGKGMTEQTLSDLGMNFIRTQLITVPGAAVPWPYGGKTREVQIDLDPAALQARGLSGQDVALALATQNLVLPAGTQKIGKFEYTIQLNSSPTDIDGLADLEVAFKPVQIARDLGDVIEVSSGVAATDRIIDSPPDGIDKGDRVRIAPGSTNVGMVAAASPPISAAGERRLGLPAVCDRRMFLLKLHSLDCATHQ